jgi:ribonuclease HII
LYLNILQSKQQYMAKLLETCYNKDPSVVEIGVDEVGRGPLFGRVYTAAVILPKDDTFDHHRMKDSKKFTKTKKSKTPPAPTKSGAVRKPRKNRKETIEEVAQYIKENAVAYSITYEDEKTIDKLNILQATQSSMHKAIRNVIQQYDSTLGEIDKKYLLVIDGNYFNAYTRFHPEKKRLEQIDSVCVEGGDNKYSAIAAASILAKVARDEYIQELCVENPTLVECYNIDSNKGYGAKKHMEGIQKYGITKWHRKSFRPCRIQEDNDEDNVSVEIMDEEEEE